MLILFVHIFFNESESDQAAKNYLSPSIEGLKQGFFVVWRFLSLIVGSHFTDHDHRAFRLFMALKYFLKPLRKIRVPVDDIAVMVTLALRLMPILLREKERIDCAQWPGVLIRAAPVSLPE